MLIIVMAQLLVCARAKKREQRVTCLQNLCCPRYPVVQVQIEPFLVLELLGVQHQPQLGRCAGHSRSLASNFVLHGIDQGGGFDSQSQILCSAGRTCIESNLKFLRPCTHVKQAPTHGGFPPTYISSDMYTHGTEGDETRSQACLG